MHDLVIRGGLVVDGSGAAPFIADIAVDGAQIAIVGTVVQPGREEINAAGCIVTPGFVDIHTHYDGLDKKINSINCLRDGVCAACAVRAEWTCVERIRDALNMAP
jgi:N-acyl-D-aspartate/D-glutamate deacylase